MNEGRGPWYLLTGLILGAVLGLAYAWLVQPVQYTNTTPASLRTDFKDQYRTLIAVAYSANNDLVRARARLDLLGDSDIYRVLAEQAQRTLAGSSAGSSTFNEARALGMLAVALGQPPAPAGGSTPADTAVSLTAISSGTPGLPGTLVSPASAATGTASFPATASVSAAASVPVVSATPSIQPGTPRPSPSPTITRTPLPTLTASPTPGSPFVLQSEELVCDPNLPDPLVQVLAYDAAGAGVPGVEAVITWEGGENHFFTGLKPELGLGYADFLMTPGSSYTLRLALGGQPVPNLTPTECEASDGSRQWGSWLLVFAQP